MDSVVHADASSSQRDNLKGPVPQIVSWTEGAGEIVKAVCDNGSLFEFKSSYFPTIPVIMPFAVELERIINAVEASKAETKALTLLCRAEQYSYGLYKKLKAKGYGESAIKMVLANLQQKNLLSDKRYASAWIRQRLRRHIEGPKSLASALSAKGLDKAAIQSAIFEEILLAEKSEERLELIIRQIKELIAKYKDKEKARNTLILLGWSRMEIDEGFDAIELS